jgi:hypothetical protein
MMQFTKYIRKKDDATVILKEASDLVPAVVNMLRIADDKMMPCAMNLVWDIIATAKTSDAYYLVLKTLYRERLLDWMHLHMDLDMVTKLLCNIVFPVSSGSDMLLTLRATEALIRHMRKRSWEGLIAQTADASVRAWAVYINLMLKYFSTMLPLDVIRVPLDVVRLPRDVINLPLDFSSPLEPVRLKLGITLGMSCAEPCASCGKDGKTYRCLGCLSAKYCSKACQVKHFKEHKDACRFVAGTDGPCKRFLRGELWEGVPGTRKFAHWRCDLEGEDERSSSGDMLFEVVLVDIAAKSQEVRDALKRNIPVYLGHFFSKYATATCV